MMDIAALCLGRHRTGTIIRSTCQDVDQSVVLEQQGPDFILFVDAKKSTNGD